MPLSLKEFASKAKGITPFDGRILAFDPGETTGFCVMEDMKIIHTSQIPTPIDDVPRGYNNLKDVFSYYALNVYPALKLNGACEDYRIYEWKSDDHKWSSVHTIKVVGFIQILADQFNIPITLRMAQVAKGFVTDDKLKLWGIYGDTKGMRHARDATRHAVYHALFTKENHLTVPSSK